MALSDIVNVTITTITTAPSQQGFGIPLVMSYHTVFPERARSYTSLAAMETDGFLTTDPAYLAVQALFSQNPRPARAIVGREVNTQIKDIKLTPVAQNSTVYTVEVNGQEASFTSDATATVVEITAGLKTAIDALGENVTTTDNGTDLDIEANSVADWFRLSVANRALIARKDNTADTAPTGIVEDIQAVQDENNDWYGLVLTNHSEDIIAAAAEYIETIIKIMIVACSDDEVYDSLVTTDIASDLKSANYARTALIYHPNAYEFAGAGWQGLALPKDPGSITWAYKTIAGVTTPVLTDSEVQALQGKNANYYQEIAGISITNQGKTASGEFIDITRGVDWIRARLQENIYGRLANLDKVPFTDRGVAIVEAEVRGVMVGAVNQEILAADPVPVVTVPLVANVPFADRANRLLPDVGFTATLAGAIHIIEIQGTVSV